MNERICAAELETFANGKLANAFAAVSFASTLALLAVNTRKQNSSKKLLANAKRLQSQLEQPANKQTRFECKQNVCLCANAFCFLLFTFGLRLPSKSNYSCVSCAFLWRLNLKCARKNWLAFLLRESAKATRKLLVCVRVCFECLFLARGNCKSRETRIDSSAELLFCAAFCCASTLANGREILRLSLAELCLLVLNSNSIQIWILAALFAAIPRPKVWEKPRNNRPSFDCLATCDFFAGRA